MTSIENIITENIDVWSSAIKQRNTQGRGSSKRQELYGVQKLRELILELAVRGLLVPQDPDDESAPIILEKIASAKKILIKENLLKQQKKLPSISTEERPYLLPKSWAWERLGNISNYGSSDKIEAKNAGANTWVLELEDVEKETSKLLKKVRFSEREFKSSKSAFKKDDVIYGKLRPYLDKVIVADEDGVCTTEMIPVRTHACILPEFLRLSMKSPYFKNYANNSTHGMNLPRMGTDKARMALIPILSMSEQKRIVAKVDELMALCDQLEQQQENSIAAHQQLVETLLAALTQAADNESFERAWSRIAANFDTLFTTENSIDQLKQTLLQLAVMGKLMPQDPSDEPASVLLEKIAAEKERLIENKVIKAVKKLPTIAEEEKLNLPQGWELTRLGNIVSRMGSGSTPRGGQSAYVDSGIPFLRSQNVWNDGLYLNDIVYISDETHNNMSNTHVLPGDVLLNITGASLGRSTIFPENIETANVNQHVTIIRLIEKNMNQFVHLGILSPLVQKLVWGRQVGMAIEGLSKKVLELFEFPIPPLAEQKRIVAKVDQLFAICDQLKTKINSAQQTQLQLADAITSQAIQ